jgi:hypothetical protein
MKFYDKNGIMLNSDKIGHKKFIDEFIDQYEPPYFVGKTPLKSVSGRVIGQNSCLAEYEMQTYLEKGIRHNEDVIKILDWKIGRINHKSSDIDGVVRYKDIPLDHFIVRNMYGKEIKVEKICNYIVSNYSTLSIQMPEEIYRNLLNLNISGLGTVYLLTLVYFISKGESPIYDRFAHQALDALEKGLKPKTGEVPKHNVPEKSNKYAFNWFESQYAQRLKTMFPSHYKERKLDRALWVYGHLFKSA